MIYKGKRKVDRNPSYEHISNQKVIDNYTNLMEELLLSDGIRDDKEFSKFIVDE